MRRVGGRDASWNKEREDNIGQNWTWTCNCDKDRQHWTELDIELCNFLLWTKLDNIGQRHVSLQFAKLDIVIKGQN